MPTFGLFFFKLLTVNDCYYYFLFWPCHVACGHLVSWWEIRLLSSALEVWSLSHWTPRDSLVNVSSSHLSARRAKDKNTDLSTLSPIVSVSLGCSDRTLEAGWLRNPRGFLLTVLEARDLGSGASTVSFWWERALRLQRATFVMHPSMVEGARRPRVSFVVVAV